MPNLRPICLVVSLAIAACGADEAVFDPADDRSPDAGAPLDAASNASTAHDSGSAIDAGAPPDAEAPDALEICMEEGCDYDGQQAGRVGCDDDGLSNAEEGRLGTNPCDDDTDRDGLSDRSEVEEGTNPLKDDSDDDGLSDADELRLGLDPLDPDTFDDGVRDSDRWFVTACDELEAAPITLHRSLGANWTYALAPAFDLVEVETRGLGPGDYAASYFDAPNGIAGVISASPVAAGTSPVDVHLDAPLRDVATVRNEFFGGEFRTWDRHVASTNEAVLEWSTPRTASQAVEAVVSSSAPDGVEFVRFPAGQRADRSTDFRLLRTVVVRDEGAITRAIEIVAVVPESIWSADFDVASQLGDVTHTGSLGRASATTRQFCNLFRAGNVWPEVDLLVVVEISDTMSDEIAALRRELAAVETFLENARIDARFAIVPMSPPGGTPDTYRPHWRTDAAGAQADLDRLQATASSGGWGLVAARSAVESARDPNASPEVAVRERALLNTVWVTDRAPQSLVNVSPRRDDPQRVALAESYEAFFEANVSTALAFVPLDPVCTDELNPTDAELGRDYQELVSEMNGRAEPTCDIRMPSTTEIAIEQTIGELRYGSGISARGYQLAGTPVSASLVGVKDNVAMERSRENGWDYFPSTNSLAFFGDARPERQSRRGSYYVYAYETLVQRNE